MMNKIYCISGMGADERIFSNLKIVGYQLVHIPWLIPEEKETIQHYAKRMATNIEDGYPVLLGVSFGGMIAIEISRLIKVRQLILISAIKTSLELPTWMRLAGKLRLHKIFPLRSNKLTEKFDNAQLGVSSEEERMLVHEYRQISNSVYLDWAIDQVLKWKNENYPESVIHIHGDKDRVFPLRKIKSPRVIEGGSHIMILNKTAEISHYVDEILAKNAE